MPHGRVFGGQVMAQALVAATKTVDKERPVHSLHGYFLRPGDVEKDIVFDVEILRDGRSFSARRVQAIQNEKVIFSMISSFQISEPGVDHQVPPTGDNGEPESLPTASSILGDIDHPSAQYWANARPFDIRHHPDDLYLKVNTKRPNQTVWLKTLEQIELPGELHSAALAFASDYTILESGLRNHEISWAHPGMASASLDHAMWFHRPFDVNRWMLYEQQSPSAQGSRNLNLGKIYQDGVLVATVAQEGMLRVPEFS
jgi:acyl-CoA thioesterase-2